MDGSVESADERREAGSGSSPAVSEPALDDDRRLDSDTSQPASDSELHSARPLQHEHIARQLKGPSSDALEADCARERLQRAAAADAVRADVDEDAGWVDLLDSKQVFRKVERAGDSDGKKPRHGDRVTIAVSGRLSDGAEVDRHAAFSFLVGHLETITAWDLCAKLMVVGERDQLKTTARFAYGALGRAPDVPPDADIVYDIELLAVEKGVDVNAMSIDDRLEFAADKKVRGNYYFERDEFKNAIQVYRNAVNVVDPLSSSAEFDKADCERLRPLRAQLFNNLAIAQLRDGALDDALESTRRCLELDADNMKAHFRRGKAFAKKHEYDKALDSLGRALKLEPDSAIIEREVLKTRQQAQQMYKQERRLYRRMFSDVRTGDAAPKWRQVARLVVQNAWSVAAAGSIVLGIWAYVYLYTSS